MATRGFVATPQAHLLKGLATILRAVAHALDSFVDGNFGPAEAVLKASAAEQPATTPAAQSNPAQPSAAPAVASPDNVYATKRCLEVRSGRWHRAKMCGSLIKSQANLRRVTIMEAEASDLSPCQLCSSGGQT